MRYKLTFQFDAPDDITAMQHALAMADHCWAHRLSLDILCQVGPDAQAGNFYAGPQLEALASLATRHPEPVTRPGIDSRAINDPLERTRYRETRGLDAANLGPALIPHRFRHSEDVLVDACARMNCGRPREEHMVEADLERLWALERLRAGGAPSPAGAES